MPYGWRPPDASVVEVCAGDCAALWAACPRLLRLGPVATAALRADLMRDRWALWVWRALDAIGGEAACPRLLRLGPVGTGALSDG